MKPRMQNQKFDFLKIALNRVLTLADYRSRRELLGSSGIIDFENNRVCKQFKHWNYRISVPMSILTLHKIKKGNIGILKAATKTKQNYYSINVNQAAKQEFRIFKDRFKSYFWHWQLIDLVESFRDLPEFVILKTTTFANNSNTEMIEFRPQCQY